MARCQCTYGIAPRWIGSRGVCPLSWWSLELPRILRHSPAAWSSSSHWFHLGSLPPSRWHGLLGSTYERAKACLSSARSSWGFLPSGTASPTFGHPEVTGWGDVRGMGKKGTNRRAPRGGRISKEVETDKVKGKHGERGGPTIGHPEVVPPREGKGIV